jgi:tRNA(Ile)-lysidine synthase
VGLVPGRRRAIDATGVVAKTQDDMTRRRRTHWKACAEALAHAIPRDRLHPEVLGWADAANGRGGIWHVALSGGADSVAVLLLLWAHWPARRRKLRALHFDHRLRGAASTEDAAFCRRLCAALGVPLVIERWERPAGAGKPSEAEARAARLRFFQRRGRVLWLGHHQDDIAETMLMRLARGSGANGLSAPRPVQTFTDGRVHLRALLTLRKQEVIAALGSCGGRWRDDATNEGSDYFRNRIRHQVLPAWEKAAQRDAVAGAARTRELLAEDDVALEQWLDALAPFSRAGELLLSRLKGKPRALWRRALHRLLLTSPTPIDISRQAFGALLAAAERGLPTRHSLGREVFGVIRNGRLRLDLGKPSAKFQRPVN